VPNHSLRLFLLALLAVLPGTGWAQYAAATVWQPDRTKPFRVFADQVSVNDALKVAAFWGNVLLIQDEVRLTCSKALLSYHVLPGDQRSVIDYVECER
jgi:lipopolysaccharide export system protein LptA